MKVAAATIVAISISILPSIFGDRPERSPLRKRSNNLQYQSNNNDEQRDEKGVAYLGLAAEDDTRRLQDACSGTILDKLGENQDTFSELLTAVDVDYYDEYLVKQLLSGDAPFILFGKCGVIFTTTLSSSPLILQNTST